MTREKTRLLSFAIISFVMILMKLLDLDRYEEIFILVCIIYYVGGHRRAEVVVVTGTSLSRTSLLESARSLT